MAGRQIDLAYHLLDRQIVDPHGTLCGKVDDVELTFPDDGGPPYASGLHSGTGALASRVDGRLGAWLESVAARLTEQPQPNLVSFGVVQRVGPDVEVVLAADDLPGARLETWFRDHIIRRIPGAIRAIE